MTKSAFLKNWSLVLGTMNLMAGLLLVFFPVLVLRFLKIEAPPTEGLVFVSWIGVFVMSVGVSYVLAMGRRGHGEAVWIFSSVVMVLTAVFLTARILGESMPGAWTLVAAACALVALVQIVLLRAGWWRDVHR
jgi:Na+-driven multidrug efflux pump